MRRNDGMMMRARAWCVCLIAPALGLSLAGCDRNELRAIVAGLEVVTSQLGEDDDISFSDWLRSELDD
jgi:hypothetical protein